MLVLRILYLYVKLNIFLRILSFDKFLKNIQMTKVKSIKNSSIKTLTLIADIEKFTSNIFLVKKCLIRSSCLYVLLKKHGFKPVMKIGVKKEASIFKSHAWVEVADHNISLLNDRNYIEIHSIQ